MFERLATLIRLRCFANRGYPSSQHPSDQEIVNPPAGIIVLSSQDTQCWADHEQQRRARRSFCQALRNRQVGRTARPPHVPSRFPRSGVWLGLSVAWRSVRGRAAREHTWSHPRSRVLRAFHHRPFGGSAFLRFLLQTSTTAQFDLDASCRPADLAAASLARLASMGNNNDWCAPAYLCPASVCGRGSSWPLGTERFGRPTKRWSRRRLSAPR